jgi:hypothetical protein
VQLLFLGLIGEYRGGSDEARGQLRGHGRRATRRPCAGGRAQGSTAVQHAIVECHSVRETHSPGSLTVTRTGPRTLYTVAPVATSRATGSPSTRTKQQTKTANLRRTAPLDDDRPSSRTESRRLTEYAWRTEP